MQVGWVGRVIWKCLSTFLLGNWRPITDLEILFVETYVDMFQLNPVLIAEPRWLYYVSAVAKVVEHPMDCNQTLDRWRPAACPLGAPVVKYISLALSIVSLDHLLWVNHVWLSGCSLITIASYWLWISIVEVFLCFSGPWTQGFTAGWFSRAGYLLSPRPGLSQEIKTWEQLFNMQRKAKFLQLIIACDGIYVGRHLWPSLRDILGLRHIHHAGIFSICWQKSPFGWVMRGIMCCYLIA